MGLYSFDIPSRLRNINLFLFLTDTYIPWFAVIFLAGILFTLADRDVISQADC